MGILIKISEWASRIRLDDPFVLTNINDISDVLRQIVGM